ncbi:MAG: D-alanyl-D-alanine carboxypeptidase family protein [Rhodovibrionaceae bacterium]
MMQTSRSFIFALLALVALIAAPPTAGAIDTAAREAILVDAETGAVLMSKDPDAPMPPASMSKIMTMYLVFQHLDEGRLSLDDHLPVSERAWRMGGSKMFIEVGKEVKVEDLIRGVIVQSGNDACVVFAEALSGSEEGFAQEMTETARELGMTDSHFANSTGWPDPNQWMTARDLATLAKRMIADYPQYYDYFAEMEFTYNEIRQGNRNPLLYRNIGVDGLKTGHTEEAGYGLTASAKQGERRLILVVNGLSSAQERADESARLLSWGFREFENYELLSSGEQVDKAEVWLGKLDSVPLVAPRDFLVTLTRDARRDMTAKVIYEGPIPAPIAEGQEVARLEISAPGMEPMVIPLVAGTEVEKLGPFGRLIASLKHLILGQL